VQRKCTFSRRTKDDFVCPPPAAAARRGRETGFPFEEKRVSPQMSWSLGS
jgi:hypothetical protein